MLGGGEQMKKAQNPSAMAGGVLEISPVELEALERLRRASPPQYLTASPELSRLAREASTHLYSSLLPFCAKPPPIDRLLADESFDAEQIWHQIELQSRPLLPALRRDLRRFEKMEPQELLSCWQQEGRGKVGKNSVAEDVEDDAEEEETAGDELVDGKGRNVERDASESDYSEDGGEDDYKDEIKDEDEDEDEEEDEDEDEYLLEHEYDPQGDGNENGAPDSGLYAKYDDFFGDKDKKSSQTGAKKKKGRSSDKLDPYDEGQEEEEEEDNDDGDGESQGDSDVDDRPVETEDLDNQETLSTFERQSRKLKAEIERMERENLQPKTWTMTGEVAATKRPTNSALEVDLDFEHNRGAPPAVTEESNDIIEEIILKRIREGHFDDVQKAPSLPSRAPKETKDLDDKKSKRGLAEIYEEEYAQATGLASVPLSSSDELKKEASLLFKKLCLKLDALSHFHFAPKPVIEDMSVQTNVPALAMEEIAPLAVSDAAMLAPEEIFSGKGDVKEDTEMSQADRKRKRAKKKRKFKAETAHKPGRNMTSSREIRV